MIGCVVLMHGVGYADPSSSASAQPPSGNPNTTVSNHPRDAGRDHQLGLSPPAGAALGGLVQNKTVNNRILPVRPLGTVSPTGPSSKNVHNRGPSPAAIGGPGDSTKNTAAINGSSMNRKR
jgi:hypothetical protein